MRIIKIVSFERKRRSRKHFTVVIKHGDFLLPYFYPFREKFSDVVREAKQDYQRNTGNVIGNNQIYGVFTSRIGESEIEGVTTHARSNYRRRI